tara:strand:- start:133 stop:1431 length:1299 start_codon:yes stop_codon:yes gene_type:complete
MSIFAAPSFYSKADQDIYNRGFSFIPREEFRGGAFAFPTAPTTTTGGDAAATGINTVLNQGGGGGGAAFTGGISDLTTAFQKAVDDRQAKLTELNRPLTTFPSFPGPKTPGGFDAQRMYNKASADLNDPFNRLATTKTFSGTRPAIDVMNYADDIIDDYRMQYATGQLGPSVVREKPTISRKIADTVYSLPFLNKPQSAQQIMEEGYTGGVGGPGIIGAIAGAFDKFSSLSRPDQAFIQNNMGYTGPTVFGENTGGGSKDPFGLNVRSGRGNYAEAVEREFNRVNDYFNSDKFADKYGADTKLELDEETGLYSFVGKNAARANQMNRMNLARYNYYNEKVKERDAFRAQEKARIEADKARTRQIQQQLDAGTFGRDDPPDRSPGSVTKESAAKTSGVGGGGYTKSDSARESRRGGQYGFMGGGLVDLVDIYD